MWPVQSVGSVTHGLLAWNCCEDEHGWKAGEDLKGNCCEDEHGWKAGEDLKGNCCEDEHGWKAGQDLKLRASVASYS
jgi:hypothetical protein